MISGSDERFEASAGTPQAIASSGGRPSPSVQRRVREHARARVQRRQRPRVHMPEKAHLDAFGERAQRLLERVGAPAPGTGDHQRIALAQPTGSAAKACSR